MRLLLGIWAWAVGVLIYGLFYDGYGGGVGAVLI